MICPAPIMAPPPAVGPPPLQAIYGPGPEIECFYPDPNVAVKIGSYDPQMDVLQRSFFNLELVDHQGGHVAPVPGAPIAHPGHIQTVNVLPQHHGPGSGLTSPESPQSYAAISPTFTPFAFPANWGQS